MKRQLITVAATLAVILIAAAAAKHSGFLSFHFDAHTDEAHAEKDGHDHDHDHDADKAKVKAKPAAPKDDDDGDEGPAVELSAEQRRIIGVKQENARKDSLRNFLQLPGEFQLNMDKTARMMPKMPGFVTEVAVSEGDRVKKGRLLATITSHKLGEFYSDYSSAMEWEKLTKSELEMAEQLNEQKSISRKDFLRYRREYADAVIARMKAEAQLKSLALPDDHRNHPGEENCEYPVCTRYEMRAPFDGIVLKKEITVGETFSEDNERPVFVISDMSELRLDLRAGESEIGRVKAGMPVEVRLSEPGRNHSGIVTYIAPLLDEGTRTGLVRVAVENRDGDLKAGAFASGVIDIGGGGGDVVIPAEALQLVNGESVVFVPDGDGYSPREVTAGRREAGYVQILSGLKEGEPYVSHGAFQLKAVLLTSGMGGHSGHGH